MIHAPSIEAAVPALGLELAVESATFTLDEGHAPYGELVLSCGAISADLFRRLDPRNHLRLVGALSGIYTPWGNIADRAKPFDLTVHARSLQDDTGTLQLIGRTGECRLIDDALLANSTYRPALTSVRAIVTHVLGTIGATLQPGLDDDTVDPESSTWMPGVTAWDYLDPVLQAAGLRLWCDEQARWWLVDADGIQNGYVELAANGSIVTLSDQIDLDTTGWYDGVAITYTWTDTAGVQHSSWDVAGTDPLRVLSLSYERKPPKPGAAARVLRRRKAFGTSVSLSAVSDFSVSPGMPCTIVLPGGRTPQASAISSVAFRLPADEMDIETRALIDVAPGSWLAVAGGVAWRDIPAGVSWAAFDADSDYSSADSWISVPIGVSWDSIPAGTAWTEYIEHADTWDGTPAGISWASMPTGIPWTDYTTGA